MGTPSPTAAPGSGTRSINASPIDLTCVPPKLCRSALTAAQKSATSAAACSSPCASVSAVNPAMSANRNVAAACEDAPADWLRPCGRLRDPSGEQWDRRDHVHDDAE